MKKLLKAKQKLLAFVKQQYARLPCWWIFGHQYPKKWTLLNGWRPGIIWYLHLEKECAKCKRSIWKEWNGKWEDTDKGPGV